MNLSSPRRGRPSSLDVPADRLMMSGHLVLPSSSVRPGHWAPTASSTSWPNLCSSMAPAWISLPETRTAALGAMAAMIPAMNVPCPTYSFTTGSGSATGSDGRTSAGRPPPLSGSPGVGTTSRIHG